MARSRREFKAGFRCIKYQVIYDKIEEGDGGN